MEHHFCCCRASGHRTPKQQRTDAQARQTVARQRAERERLRLWWFFSNYGECFAGQVKVETPEEFRRRMNPVTLFDLRAEKTFARRHGRSLGVSVPPPFARLGTTWER